jgi:hypothetical protein
LVFAEAHYHRRGHVDVDWLEAVSIVTPARDLSSLPARRTC